MSEKFITATRYLGVDPGLSGAFATLTVWSDGRQDLRVTPAPVDWMQIGKGRRRFYNVPWLYETLNGEGPVTLAYLERQGPRPGQGVTSTFSIGEGYGMWLALLVATHTPFSIVAPVRWQTQVGLQRNRYPSVQARKRATQHAARHRFPAIPIKVDHADAVMLAVAAALEHGLVERGQHESNP